jgi:prefoldin alpha subunit
MSQVCLKIKFMQEVGGKAFDCTSQTSLLSLFSLLSFFLFNSFAQPPFSGMGEEVDGKIRRFQGFLDDSLRASLRHLSEKRDAAYDEIGAYLSLRNSLDVIHGKKKLTSMVHLGSEVYVEAKVKDSSQVFVDVGLGFHIAMSHEEALAFIEEKEKILTKYATHASTLLHAHSPLPLCVTPLLMHVGMCGVD